MLESVTLLIFILLVLRIVFDNSIYKYIKYLKNKNPKLLLKQLIVIDKPNTVQINGILDLNVNVIENKEYLLIYSDENQLKCEIKMYLGEQEFTTLCKVFNKHYVGNSIYLNVEITKQDLQHLLLSILPTTLDNISETKLINQTTNKMPNYPTNIANIPKYEKPPPPPAPPPSRTIKNI